MQKLRPSGPLICLDIRSTKIVIGVVVTIDVNLVHLATIKQPIVFKAWYSIYPSQVATHLFALASLL